MITDCVFSLVISTRNRAGFLPALFRSVESAQKPSVRFSVVLVDSASTDETYATLTQYASTTSLSVIVVRADKPGLSVARNLGVTMASGEMVFFTDDDCRLHPQFFQVAAKICAIPQVEYGGGQILRGDAADDPRIAYLPLSKNTTIKPYTPLLAPGFIQGANLFARQTVIKKLRGFDEMMGAGTEFPCEDIDFCNRASQAGFTGARIRELVIYHHHGKQAGSAEADRVVAGYNRGCGAYHMANIQTQTDDVWRSYAKRYNSAKLAREPEMIPKLQRELCGAADYLAALANTVQKQRPSINFDSLLIVTHGRSGSTLLQGVLNSIPGVVCKGENNNVAYHLFQGLRAIESAQHLRLNVPCDEPAKAWYGVHEMSKDMYLQYCRELIKRLVLPTEYEQKNTACYGFKEIRYADIVDEMLEYLEFLRVMMPNPLIIFLTRDVAEVKKSQTRLKWDKQTSARTLRTLAEIFEAEVARDPSCHILLDYTDIISASPAIHDLYRRLGALFCPKTYAEILAVKHGP